MFFFVVVVLPYHKSFRNVEEVQKNESEFERKEVLTKEFLQRFVKRWKTRSTKVSCSKRELWCKYKKKLPETPEDNYFTKVMLKKKFCNATNNTGRCVFYHTFVRKFLIGILMKMERTAIPPKLRSINNLNLNVVVLCLFFQNFA